MGTSGGAGDARAAVSALAEGLERLAGAALWPLGDGELAEVAGLLDQVRRLADGQTVRLLGEVDSRGLPGQDGTGSPGAWLRKVSPTLRPAEAAGLGKQAQTLYRSALSPELAPTRGAPEAGALRVCQARVVTDTIEKLSPPHVPADGPEAIDADQVTTAQVMLLDDATRLPAADLAKCATAIRHHLDPSADDRLARDEKAQHRQRCLILSTEASGMTFLQGLLTKEAGAALRTAIDAWSAPQPADDGTPDPRTAGQRRHDALQRLAETTLARDEVPTSHGSHVKVIVRVTGETLAAAIAPSGPDQIKPTGLPPAELDDGTPISRQLLARLSCGAALVPVLLDDLGNPLEVGRTLRDYTARQRTALIERDRHCTWPGCTAPVSWCDAHHVDYWEHGGRTDLTRGALLCGRHHRYVHATGATARLVDGQIIWTEPGSPPESPPPDPQRWQRQYLQRLTRQWLVPRRE
ncbi:hypothetical protein ASD06_08730 [Angustibacter sp. Root456]|nr:hypothetical protein ASD06_08730 [Angustibacter sp. Root456]